MKRIKNLLIILILLFIFSGIKAQDHSSSALSLKDSVQLKQVLYRVLTTFPTIGKAETAVEIAREKTNGVKIALNPYIDLSGSYTRIGPVPVFDIPQFGELKLYPNDNFNASINYYQNIYDFGKTKAGVAVAKGNESVSETGVEHARQVLAMNTINVFYTLVYLQNAINIKNEQIKNLNDLVDFTQKKINTGTATNYELLNTQVRLSATQGQISELKSMKTGELSVLSSLLDTLVSNETLFSHDLDIAPVSMGQNEMITKAISQRDEVRTALQQLNVAQMQYSLAKASNNPSIGLYAQAGDKNGYQPDINKMTLNYSAGISVNVPIYDGRRQKTSMSLAQSGVQEAQYDLDLIKRKVTNEVVQDYSDLTTAEDKIDQYRMQVSLAGEAYSLAKINYQAGAITDLDLLTTETNLSGSRLLLLKARVDYVLGLYKLKMSTGDKLYEF